jgi:hypothetical protein
MPVCCQFDDPHFPLHGFAMPWEVGFLTQKVVMISSQPDEVKSAKNSG